MAELKLKTRERSLDQTADIYARSAVAVCATCEAILGKGYPLWGVHFDAAVALHYAHRAAQQLIEVPALTPEDRLFGRRLVIGDAGRHG